MINPNQLCSELAEIFEANPDFADQTVRPFQSAEGIERPSIVFSADLKAFKGSSRVARGLLIATLETNADGQREDKGEPQHAAVFKKLCDTFFPPAVGDEEPPVSTVPAQVTTRNLVKIFDRWKLNAVTELNIDRYFRSTLVIDLGVEFLTPSES